MTGDFKVFLSLDSLFIMVVFSFVFLKNHINNFLCAFCDLILFFATQKTHLYYTRPLIVGKYFYIPLTFFHYYFIYITALLPGVLRRSESCCHKSPLPTLSLRTCLVGIFICKRPGSARFEALHERPEATRTAALHRKPQGHTPGKIRMYRVLPAHLHHDPALWADIIIEIPCFLMV